jgi:hypothetical protein
MLPSGLAPSTQAVQSDREPCAPELFPSQLWFLILAMRSGNEVVAGMVGVNVSDGIGVIVNVLAAGTVAAGGFLNAREEKLF